MANQNNKWIELGMKYGGFMEQDRIFLENRLASLDNDLEKKLLITPPASVLNAYFAELYQKRSPKDATTYYFELSKALDMFQEQPHFQMEGQAGAESFRFIRLNLSGKSFGFCYQNDREEARVFSEFPNKITPALLFEIAQIFPDYVLIFDTEKIVMKPAVLGGRFEPVKALSPLTDLSENDGFMKLSGYNADELVAEAEKIGYFHPLLLQCDGKLFSVYIQKGL